MATVVSAPAVGKKLKALEWQIGTAELLEVCKTNNIAASELVAYLDAALTNPDGFDDAAIPNCPAATATKLTNGLKKQGCTAV